jgi:hypothetical protein
MTKHLALACLLALGAPAAADNLVATSEPPPFRMVDARLGVLLGAAQVGDTNSFAPGISGGIGYRMGDLTLRATGDYYRVGDDPSTTTMARRGRATRLGGAARYAFAHTDYSKLMNFDFWGGLGGGYEHVAWLVGGVLDRPSAELAFGLDAGHRSEPDRRGRSHEIGYFMAFRTFVGEAPEMAGAIATCGGPCTQATKPPRTDVSMFFDFGVQWGR